MKTSFDQRVSIKFCVKLGHTFVETYALLKQAYPGTVLSKSAAFQWFKRFETGCEDIGQERIIPKLSKREKEEKIATKSQPKIKDKMNATQAKQGLSGTKLLETKTGTIIKKKLEHSKNYIRMQNNDADIK